mgnify:CR=1 FL=1
MPGDIVNRYLSRTGPMAVETRGRARLISVVDYVIVGHHHLPDAA